MIQIDNLTKVYPNGVTANQNITISIGKKECVGILEVNGAGKTTLIRQILKLISSTEGSIVRVSVIKSGGAESC